MKAIIKTGEVLGLEYREVARPIPKSNEVLIAVEAAAICGTDLHYYYWDQNAKDFAYKFNLQFPLILGHEFSGVIVEIGSEVKTKHVGQRVSIETHIPCGTCFQCKTGEAHNCANMGTYGTSCDGCFSAYALADESIVFELPDDISFEEGALLEPAGVAMRAVEEAQIKPGDTVVVIGCGPIGLMIIQIAKVCGAARIIATDLDEYRLNMAKKFGADIINIQVENTVEVVKKMTAARGGADIIIEASGSAKAYDVVFDMLRLEGRVITLGHPGGLVPINITQNINLKGASIKGIFGRRIWGTWMNLISLIQNKRINVLDVVTHRFLFSQYNEAFEQVRKGGAKILFIKD